MYRGTTPTITINCDIDVSEFVTMWVTFRTQQLATYAPPKQVEVTKHLGDEGVDATDKVVTVSLTQADTLLLGSLSPDEDQQVSDLVADLMEANDLLLTDPEERELRYRAQRSALRNCRKLIHHIELAHEILSGFSDDAFAYWAKMAAGVKNQTAKWYKTDKERAAKLDAQKRHQ